MMNKWLLGALLAVASLSASAQVTLAQFPPSASALPGGGWVFDGVISGQAAASTWTTGSTFGTQTGARAWVNGVYGSVPKMVATDSLALAGRAGALPVAVASTVLGADALAAVGRCLLGANVYCAAGTAAYMLYKAYRATPSGDTSQASGWTQFAPGQFDYDPGTAPVGGTTWSGQYGTSGNISAAAAVQSVVDTQMPLVQGTGGCANGGTLNNVQSPAPNAGTATINYTASTWNGSFCQNVSHSFTSVISSQTGGAQSCPASVDPFNAAYNIPAGSPVGPDGKCPTARYNHIQQTSEQVAATILNGIDASHWAAFQPVAGGVIDTGGQSVPATVSVSGPASQTGPSSVGVTTGPGTTAGTKTVTATSTPTYNYTYNNQKISYTTTVNVTTVTNDNGAVTTVNSSSSSGTPTPQDPLDPCTANPTRSGCVDIGSAPTAEKIPNTSVPVTVTPTVFLSSAGCPPDIQFNMMGKAYAISYGPMCSLMTTLRVIFLATGGLAAAWIFQEGLFSL